MMQLLTTTLALLFLALAANTATAKRRSNLLHLQSLSRHYRGDNIFDNTIYPYETKHYDQKIDHFTFSDENTYPQRYLYNDDYWTAGGPIFFTTGCEGDIVHIATKSKFIWDIAPEFGALLVFAEHRYYGESWPFGNDSLVPNPEKNGFLSSEQALADFAELLSYIKSNVNGTENSPVITFGGSYCGMLSAWFRIKYPHLVDGSIASSAPVLQMDTPCEGVAQVITEDFRKANPKCKDNIQQSWAALDTIGKDEEGKEWLTKEFVTCSPVKTDTDMINFKDALFEWYWGLAQYNYPPYPVQVACKLIVDAPSIADDPNKKLLTKIAKARIDNQGGACFEVTDPDDDFFGWDYQSCTEMVMPFCTDGVHDMFYPSPWNYTQVQAYCQEKWQVTPRPAMADLMYGGKKLQAASNIVFTNGDVDPYSSGGILEDINPTVVALHIEGGAHCSDIEPVTFPAVEAVRDKEKQHIARWILEARGRK